MIKLEYKEHLIARSKYLMEKYKLTPFEAIVWAEQELEKQIENEERLNGY